MKTIKENEKPVFEIEDRGYSARAWYLSDPKGESLVEIKFGEEIVRKFLFPSYKIWNIPAHFTDIIDSEIAKNANGYQIAASTGLGGSVGIRTVED